MTQNIPNKSKQQEVAGAKNTKSEALEPKPVGNKPNGSGNAHQVPMSDEDMATSQDGGANKGSGEKNQQPQVNKNQKNPANKELEAEKVKAQSLTPNNRSETQNVPDAKAQGDQKVKGKDNPPNNPNNPQKGPANKSSGEQQKKGEGADTNTPNNIKPVQSGGNVKEGNNENKPAQNNNSDDKNSNNLKANSQSGIDSKKAASAPKDSAPKAADKGSSPTSKETKHSDVKKTEEKPPSNDQAKKNERAVIEGEKESSAKPYLINDHKKTVESKPTSDSQAVAPMTGGASVEVIEEEKSNASMAVSWKSVFAKINVKKQARNFLLSFSSTSNLLIALIFASIMVISYFGFIETNRYATESQFVVKQADTNEVSLAGLASLGTVTPSVKDSLIIKEFILSRAMVTALDKEINLKSHYQSSEIDYFSRLQADATVEEFVGYYRDLVSVHHDEMSDILYLEVQAFDPDFSLLLAQQVIKFSEKFINGLGDKMITEQLQYAQEEVERAQNVYKEEQRKLLEFQDKNLLINPVEEGGAIQQAINGLQAELISAEARLKELSATIREDAPEVRAQKTRIRSLEQQLQEERLRLASPDQGALNKVNLEYGSIELSVKLAADLYKSSLASFEMVRAETYRKLKHLLVVQPPSLADENKYPLRFYNIVTWLVIMICIYLLLILVMAIVREHSE